jgi:hypothetical protein
MKQFNIFVNRNGVEVKLTEFSPAAIRQQLERDHHENMQREIGQHLKGGERLSFEPIRRMVNSKKFSPMQRGLVRTFASGGLWTCSRSRAAGYDVSTMCSLCGDHEDTLTHRLYECTGSAEVVKQRDMIVNGDPTFRARATDVDNQLLYLHGLVTIPLGWPEPTAEVLVKRMARNQEGLLKEIDDGESLPMAGHLASDGSCRGGGICTKLARAGWAAVQAEQGTGKVEKVIYGAVWDPFPQNSQAGEWLAAAAAIQSVEVGSGTLDIDCQSVLNGLSKFKGPGWLSYKDAWAGVRRSITNEQGMTNIKQFNKVKAHVGEGTRTWQETANEWADHYASEGRMLHEQPTEAMRNELKFQAAELRKVVQLVLEVFTLWPTQQRAGRLPRPVRLAERAARIAAPDGHNWQRQNGGWQCTRCLGTSRVHGKQCPAKHEEVAGFAQVLVNLGHRPVEVRMEQGSLLWICASCGKYVQTKRKSILEPCPLAAGPYGAAALARVSRNKHPDTHKNGKVVSCWDCLAKREVASAALRLSHAQQPLAQGQRGAIGPARRRRSRAH